MNILDILYETLCSNMALPEEQAVLQREETFLDELERRLGPEDFERFWDISTEIGCCRAKHDFRLGFCLGVNLILMAKSETFPQK